MTYRRRKGIVLFLKRCGVLLMVVTWMGCSSSGDLPTAQVKGKVTYKGKPVTSGTVMFVPDKGPAATGEIDKDGTYLLGTYDIDDGAVLGWHKVAITALEDIGGLLPEQPKALPAPTVPAKYLSQETSGLRVEVKSDVNEFDFPLVD